MKAQTPNTSPSTMPLSLVNNNAVKLKKVAKCLPEEKKYNVSKTNSATIISGNTNAD